jgi:hypothetical protein
MKDWYRFIFSTDKGKLNFLRVFVVIWKTVRYGEDWWEKDYMKRRLR